MAQRAFARGAFDPDAFDVEEDVSTGWVEKPKQSETWTEKIKQSEA